MKQLCTLAVVALCAAAGSTAHADIVNIGSGGFGIEGNGSFSGTVAYAAGTLTITLTNDMASAAGGKITGLAFNIDGNATASLISTTYASFADLGTGVSAPPFGTFDHGAAMGGSWTGGGSPNAGIVRGATGTFVFAVTGAGAGSLTAANFVSASGTDFVVRFRGFTNGGSDKVVGHIVPAPASLALAGVGALALGRRRRN